MKTTEVSVLSVKETVLSEQLLRLVLERTKLALMDAEELASHVEKLRVFDVSTHMPERAALLESADYESEHRSIEDYLSKQSDFVRKPVCERYASGFKGEIDLKDSDGATFTLVDNRTGIPKHIILLRRPLRLSVLVHEVLHIFEEYLGLGHGELAIFSRSIAEHLKITIK